MVVDELYFAVLFFFIFFSACLSGIVLGTMQLRSDQVDYDEDKTEPNN